MTLFKKKNKDSSSHDKSCSGCSSCGSILNQMGIDTSKWDYCVALAGNPNTGKSTVFNAITGLRQHTGNWPGKTVTRAEGGFKYEGKQYKLIDLPGTYSLLSTSTDEEIARDFILFGRPDCTIVVVDATCLERNLNLVLQVIEITDRVVIALNLMDEAKRKGIEIDHRTLSRDLGIPVIPMVAKSGEGLNLLLAAVSDVICGNVKNKPYRIKLDENLSSLINELTPWVKKACPETPNAPWIAMRLLDGDQHIRQAVLNNDFEHLYKQKDES